MAAGAIGMTTTAIAAGGVTGIVAGAATGATTAGAGVTETGMTTAATTATIPGRAIETPGVVQAAVVTTIPSRLARLELVIEKEVPWPATLRAAGDLLGSWGLNKSPQEALWVIAYDANRNLRTVVEVARGGYIHVDIHIPSVLSAVLVSGSERFLIAHNHQNGHAAASQQDVAMTQDIQDAAATAGLYLEDHLIVTPQGRTFSFVASGLYVPPAYSGEGNRMASGRYP